MWRERPVICVIYLSVLGIVLPYSTGKPTESNGPEEVIPRGCDRSFYSVSSQHTMCLHSAKSTSEGVSAEELNLISDYHNKARGQIGSPSGSTSSNQQKLVWDQELARLAQNWASNCQNFHDSNENRVIPGKYPVGQNLALSYGKYRDWRMALNVWDEEKADFKYGVGPRGYPPRQIGHYTQMVWAETSRLGCGYALCNKTTHFYVCNYGPAGNVAKWRDPSAQYKPYKLGPRGGDCPHAFDKSSGLCDCGGKTCYNGGALDLDTCQCTCSDRAWIDAEQDCSLRCQEAADIPKCASRGGPWGPKECAKFSNLPYDYCPITCAWCPYRHGRYWQSPGIPKFPSDIDVPKSTPEFSGGGNGETTTSTTSVETDLTDRQGEGTVLPTVNEQGEGVGEEGGSAADEGQTDSSGSVEPGVDVFLPPCVNTEEANCGQPSRTGYWSKDLCYNPYIQKMCPAMCAICTASKCVDYQGGNLQIGDHWITSFGRFTCTVHGVEHERGCMRNGVYIRQGETYTYQKYDVIWRCTCYVSGFSYRVSCSGARTENY